jgi:hypothetical protein
MKETNETISKEFLIKPNLYCMRSVLFVPKVSFRSCSCEIELSLSALTETLSEDDIDSTGDDRNLITFMGKH